MTPPFDPHKTMYPTDMREPPAPGEAPDADPTAFLARDNLALKRAGDHLATASMRVIEDSDGVHRLRLAVAEWNRTIADEGGRAERFVSAPAGEAVQRGRTTPDQAGTRDPRSAGSESGSLGGDAARLVEELEDTAAFLREHRSTGVWEYFDKHSRVVDRAVHLLRSLP